MIRLQAALPVVTILLIAAGTAFAAPAAPTAADDFLAGVRKTVLPNGLTVITRPQPGSGVVAINTWVKAGYFHEPDEVAGMAHLFEHMFFKGSKAYPEAEAISQAVSSVGGVLNAGTIYDSTNYFFVVPKEGFVRGVEIQADAIINPLFDPAELKKEAEVVIEESNRKLDNAAAVALERMYATAYTQHRIKRWRIGSNEVLRNIKRDDLLAFFQTLYRPENIIIGVAGDVSHEEALAVVSQAFAPLPKGTLVKTRGPAEPLQQEFRFGQSAADVQQGYSVFGWHTVPESHQDELTLEVLARILGGGRSSRLYRAAVAPEAASTVQAFHQTFEDTGLLVVRSAFDEKNRAEVDVRIVREVERLKAHGPTAYELALARNGAEVDLLSSIEDSLGQVQALLSEESRGSYKNLGTRLARLASMTVEDVRAAARAHLVSGRMTLYHYQPKGAPALTRDAALARFKGAATQAQAAPPARPVPQVQSRIASATADRPLQQLKLSNGVELVVRERRGAPLVSTGVYFRGGRSAETKANNGITRVMTAAMRRGTTTRSGEELDQQIEFLGSQIGVEVLDDYFGFTVGSVTRFYEPALDLLADVLLNPTFPADGVETEKHLRLGAIKRTLDSSTDRPFQLYRAAQYGDHPYGLNTQGDAGVVAGLTVDGLKAWWRSTVVADGATIIVVGDVKAEDVQKAMEARLRALPRAAAVAATAPLPALPSTAREATESRDRKQTAMIIGFPAVPPSHADWPALQLLENVTSGMSGTFFAELRGKRSLAYTVFAANQPLAQHGYFYSYLATEAAKEAEARTALLAEIRRLQGEGVQTEEVERARSYFAGSTRIDRQGNDALRQELAAGRYLGVGYDFVDRLLERMKTLSAEDLRAAAKRHLAGDNYVFAAVRGATAAK